MRLRQWAFALLVLLLLLTAAEVFAQKETAALFMPVTPEGMRPVKVQYLLNLMEEELSTRFVLLSNTKVYDAYERAIMLLPEKECTEDNCLALMQKFLEVRLIFTFGVLVLKDSVVLALKLQDGPQKFTKNVECENPCRNKQMKKGVSTLVAMILEQSRKKPELAAPADPAIHAELDTAELQEGGSPGILSVKLGAKPTARVAVGVLSLPKSLLDLQPDTVEFGPENWEQFQQVRVYARNDARMNGRREAELVVQVSESSDMNYGFVDPVTLKVAIEDDDTKGTLRLVSQPRGAAVLVDGKALLDADSKPVVTPAEIRLDLGKRKISLKLRGHRQRSFTLKVRRARLGTRSVMLEPLPAVVVVRVSPRNRNGELLLDGQHRVPLAGKTKLELKLEPGRHTVQLRHKNAESEVQTLMLKPGKRTEAVFGPMQLAPSQKQRTTAQVASPEWSVGVGLEQIVAKGSKFPWNRVAWSLPRIHLQNVNGTGGFEVGYLSGAGKTETFTASDDQKNYVVSSVNVQRLSLQYHSSPFAGLGISAIGGINQTSLAFSSDSGTLQHSSVGLEGGLCHSLKMGKFRLRTDAMMASSSSISLNLGVGYVF